MSFTCTRCGQPIDLDDLLPDWTDKLVCPTCVYDSIPEQPPMPKEQIDRIMNKVLTRIAAPNN